MGSSETLTEVKTIRRDWLGEALKIHQGVLNAKPKKEHFAALAESLLILTQKHHKLVMACQETFRRVNEERVKNGLEPLKGIQ